MKTLYAFAAGIALAGVAGAASNDADERDRTNDLIASDEAARSEEDSAETDSSIDLATFTDVTTTWGGRLFNDFSFANADDMYPIAGADGFEFRQARLWVDFKIGEHISGAAQFDFAGTGTAFKDVYAKTKTPIGEVKVGHFKQPLGLERLGSSGATTFMEVATPTEAFTPSRDNGIQSSGTIGEGTRWALGIFRRTDDDAALGTGGGEFTTTGRVHHTVGEKDQVLHLGVSASIWGGQDVRFRFRPENHIVSTVADTTMMPSARVSIYAAEAAWIRGNLSAQGEYIMTSIDEFGGAGSADVDLSGFYAFVSYFFGAADHRAYSASSGSFSRVKPAENWNGSGFSGGAKELALRISSTDFDEADGRQVDNITLGFNWYLNPNARIMVNAIRSNVDDGAGIDDDMTALMMRFQVRF